MKSPWAGNYLWNSHLFLNKQAEDYKRMASSKKIIPIEQLKENPELDFYTEKSELEENSSMYIMSFFPLILRPIDGVNYIYIYI